ncbi:hypothetical protein K1719_040496 [Acacia pycnantha]|nr:hypothetical protein K1719_040496 [Acacia pycnantha]
MVSHHNGPPPRENQEAVDPMSQMRQTPESPRVRVRRRDWRRGQTESERGRKTEGDGLSVEREGELTGRRSRALQASLVSGLGKYTCSSIKDKLSERNLVEGAVSVRPTEPSNNPGRGQFSKQGKVSGAKG